MSTELQTLVAQLARARATETALRARIADLEDRIARTPLGLELAALQSQLGDVRSHQADVDHGVRELAVSLYEATDDKRPHPAVGIRVNTKIVYDPGCAFTWCYARLPHALKLDARFFEKHARAVAQTDPIDFVTITPDPVATVDSDLSPYLEPETAGPVAEPA